MTLEFNTLSTVSQLCQWLVKDKDINNLSSYLLTDCTGAYSFCFYRNVRTVFFCNEDYQNYASEQNGG